MKDYGWKIKISDLLNNPGSSDTIYVKNKFLSDKDIRIEDEGISCEIFLQSLSNEEILCKIKNLYVKLHYICDKCGSDFTKNLNLSQTEDIRFINESKITSDEKIHDTVFPINEKNQTIDLNELIGILIKENEPIIKNCGKHDENVLKNDNEKNTLNCENGLKLGNFLTNKIKNKKNQA